MWRDDSMYMTTVYMSPQAIHATVKVSFYPSSWFISIIYASTDFLSRLELWYQLSSLSDNIISFMGKSWLVGGDFNEILCAVEKFNGSRIYLNRSNLF